MFFDKFHKKLKLKICKPIHFFAPFLIEVTLVVGSFGLLGWDLAPGPNFELGGELVPDGVLPEPDPFESSSNLGSVMSTFFVFGDLWEYTESVGLIEFADLWLLLLNLLTFEESYVCLSLSSGFFFDYFFFIWIGGSTSG